MRCRLRVRWVHNTGTPRGAWCLRAEVSAGVLASPAIRSVDIVQHPSAAERSFGDDRSFLAALVRRADTRMVMYVPADGPARTLWRTDGTDEADERRFAERGRAWLAEQASGDRPPDDPELAFAELQDSGGAPIGVLLAGKSTGASWTADERDVVRFAVDFYGSAFDERFAPTSGSARAGRPESGIVDALGRGELELVYQPEYDLLTREVVAVEALLRWRHPEHGELGPDSFIAQAERSGLITVIGAWVIDRSVRALASWNAALPERRIMLRVNVSPVQLEGDELVTLFEAALDGHDVSGDQLCIELTENAPLRNTAEVADTLRRLKKLGISSAIDDLASGYNTLSQLRVLPVDVIKLDRSLVAGLDRDARAQAIVTALLGLALNFGLEVVAEGVEREAEARTLLELGCTRAQGHHLGRPVPAERVVELLNGQNG